MKKLITTLIITLMTICVMGVTAYAASGDIAGTLYTTDILTRVDGMDIPSYCIDGQTLIAVEDLRYFGYNVAYDDSIRTLFATYNNETYKPGMGSVERGIVGGTAGNYYETDIKVYVNGNKIPAYAIDGVMAVVVEELGQPDYFAAYSYDDSQRLLSLYTEYEGKLSYEQAEQYIIDNFNKMGSIRNDLVRYYTDLCTVFLGTRAPGAPVHNTEVWYAYILYKNGVYFPLDDIINDAYNPYGGWNLYINLRTDRYSDFYASNLSLYFTETVTEATELYREYNEDLDQVVIYMDEETYDIQHKLNLETMIDIRSNKSY